MDARARLTGLRTALGIEKFAATRQVEVLRQLARKGDWDGVNALTKQLNDAGVLKVSGPGTNLSRLGTGVEAIADTVVGSKAHPGLAVRKTYDQHSPLYSKELIENKVNALRRIRSNPELDPHFARLHGGLGKGRSGARYTTQEFVPGPEHGLSFSNEERLQGILNNKPVLVDLHPGNIHKTPTGPKIIDMLAVSGHRMGDEKPLMQEYKKFRRADAPESYLKQKKIQAGAAQMGHNPGPSNIDRYDKYLKGPHTGVGHASVLKGLGPGSPRSR